jgi:hypothetical protein
VSGVDYRRFLARREEVVAPVVDGRAWLRDRAVRCAAEPGWHRVAVAGRGVEVGAAATAEEIAAALARLPAVRGPVIALDGGWGVTLGGAGCERIDLAPPGEDPPGFAPVVARRWPIGELLLWEGLELEGEAEEEARRALEEGRGIDGARGVSAALRAAFVFATARRAGRELGIAAAPAEVRRWLGEIAAEGRPAAERALRALERERDEHAARQRMLAEVRREAARIAARPPPPRLDIEERVERAMRHAGARALGVRRSGEGLIEVRWTFHGQRFVSVVEEVGLRVVDSGVCLAGEDDLVTLESLPGVIFEAMNTELLVITRHDA